MIKVAHVAVDQALIVEAEAVFACERDGAARLAAPCARSGEQRGASRVLRWGELILCVSIIAVEECIAVTSFFWPPSVNREEQHTRGATLVAGIVAGIWEMGSP